MISRARKGPVHLAEKVLPGEMVRQWVCSLPWRLRYPLGYDKALCSGVLAAFTLEVQRSLKHRAKKVFGLASMSEAFTGGITFIQRFDSAPRLNVHFHSLFLDGVFVRSIEGALEFIEFIELPEPSPEQVEELALSPKLLERAGKSLDPEMADVFEDDSIL